MIKLCLIVFFFNSSCTSSNYLLNKAEFKSRKLLEEISKGSASKHFSAKYFSNTQINLLLNELIVECDFINRKGNFVNSYPWQKDGKKYGSFIYEFNLKCDAIRLVITYELNTEIELIAFALEPIEKDNFMIKNPEKRLYKKN